ncbi:MAG: DUF4397 domain-containing protein [Ginsengibacter sp.]
MKTKFFSILQNKFFYLFLLGVFTFSACKKDADVISTPTSRLMALNLIPDSTEPVVFVLSNKSITNAPLSFTNYSGTYLPVYSGSRTLGLYKAAGDSALAKTDFNFMPEKYYSVFALGADGNYKNFITEDYLDSLPSSTGNAFVRYINAIPDSTSPIVTILANGTTIESGNASFGKVSNFIGVKPGDVSFTVNNESDISASRTISLEKDRIYTVLIMGLPNAIDTAQSIQIKYISNGTITP